MPTEREKMLAGLPYNSRDAELQGMAKHCKRLTHAYNLLNTDQQTERRVLLEQLLGHAGEEVFIEPPFFCDFGVNISLGDFSFINFNCIILDCHYVTIGKHVLIAPGVKIYAVGHPIDPAERVITERSNSFLQSSYSTVAAPVTIEDDVWIGGGVIIVPGVTIGRGSVIGAGSVVTRNIPAGVVAAGNPCKVIRNIVSVAE